MAICSVVVCAHFLSIFVFAQTFFTKIPAGTCLPLSVHLLPENMTQYTPKAP